MFCKYFIYPSYCWDIVHLKTKPSPVLSLGFPDRFMVFCFLYIPHLPEVSAALNSFLVRLRYLLRLLSHQGTFLLYDFMNSSLLHKHKLIMASVRDEFRHPRCQIFEIAWTAFKRHTKLTRGSAFKRYKKLFPIERLGFLKMSSDWDLSLRSNMIYLWSVHVS